MVRIPIDPLVVDQGQTVAGVIQLKGDPIQEGGFNTVNAADGGIVIRQR